MRSVSRGSDLRVVVGLALALGAARLAAQASPAGGELQVNSYTTSRQGSPALAVAADGGFVVAWMSLGSSGADASLWGILGQRFDGGGVPLAGEFQVNSYTSGSQTYPAVAALADGGFVVAWRSDGSFGSDTSSGSVQVQRYAADGRALGGQLQVNTYTTFAQRFPAVAAARSGGFVVAWESLGSDGGDMDEGSIHARSFGTDGGPAGPQLQVNAYTTGNQADPAVAADARGGFVVAWTSYGSAGTDGDLSSVQARRFAADGTPLGGEFQVNTYTTSFQQQPAVAMSATGEFVVAWASFGSPGRDTSTWSVQARRFSAAGVPAGDQFEVNEWTSGGQWYPALACDPRGNVVVLWESWGSPGNDAGSLSVQARRFGTDGRALEEQFQVNTWADDDQQLPAVGVDALGNYVTAWASFGSSGSDVDLDSIQAQRYDGILRDGFETGDTGRWSSTVP